MRICERCGTRYRGGQVVCVLDGHPLKEAPDPLVGRTIAGRYVIERLIAQGGMGRVYQSRNEVLGRAVAIKFLSPELARRPDYKARFLREARAANSIEHEHIIDITDFGETPDGLVYLAMEYLDGQPLNEVIALGPLDLRRAFRIARQAALALGRAHELDVVHRDIKPDNLYLVRGRSTEDSDDFLKIIDFGLAQMKGQTRLTLTGAVFGTPEYMAPEQARGAPLDALADLYSLGCVLYEMVTGEVPFSGTPTDILFKHIRETPPLPSARQASIPASVDAIIMQLLEKAKTARFASGFQLADQLEAWLLAHSEPGALRASAGDTPDEPSRPDSVDRTVDPWRDRIRLLCDLANQAHRGTPPGWLTVALKDLETRVERLRTVDHEFVRRVTAVNLEEERVRQVRRQIGRAVDELSRDQESVAARLEAVCVTVYDAKKRRTRDLTRVAEMWRSLRAAADPWKKPELGDANCPEAGRAEINSAEVDSEATQLRLLSSAGELAERCLDAQLRIDELEQRAERLRNELDDLQFQIAQLKGRLGSENAVSRMELDGLREQTEAVDVSVQSELEDLARAVEPLVAHLRSFPELRPQLEREVSVS